MIIESGLRSHTFDQKSKVTTLSPEYIGGTERELLLNPKFAAYFSFHYINGYLLV